MYGSRIYFTVLLVCLVRGSLGLADDFPAIISNETDVDASPMSAEQAAESIRLPDGFQATVFASEPEVQNPIAMTWDLTGRMWVAENYTYSGRKQHFDLSLRDRVIILDDIDQDGHADVRKVFTDDVQMLTSVEVGRGGVWLMCPPNLLFVPDADGDDVPDGPAEVVLDGFTVAESNYHNFANGLRWGPDGWLYGRCGHSCPGRLGVPGTPNDARVPIDGGIWRFHVDRKTVEVLTHGTVNPWGHDWDRDGELFFINTVIGHLWHAIPGAHFIESFGESNNPLVYQRLDMIADHYHYDRTGTSPESRDDLQNQFGGGHAHVGMTIYQSNRWPEEFHNQLFTLNLHGKRANVESVRRQGTGYTASHEPDFLVASDPFFRGTEISVGADGNMFVLDWSDTGECHEHSGVHRTSGRIFKISHENMDDARDPVHPLTKPACLAGKGKLPELWRDYQNNRVTRQQLEELLNDPDEHVRVWAIRLLTDHWPLDTMNGPLPDVRYPDDPQAIAAFAKLARVDPSGLVLLALSSSLQRVALLDRVTIASELLQRESFADDRDLPAMIWFGLMPLADHHGDRLAEIASACKFPTTLRWITRAIASKSESDGSTLESLLEDAVTLPATLRQSILMGMADAFRGWRDAPRPRGWKEFSAGLTGEHAATVAELNVLFGDGRALDELRKIVQSSGFDVNTRRSALKTLIAGEPDDLQEICLALLNDREISAVAAIGLSHFNDPQIGQELASRYRRFHSHDRPGLVEILVSRPSFAHALLDRVDANQNPIPRQDITAYHARQILTFADPSLRKKLAESWGTIRDSPVDRSNEIEATKRRLTPAVLAGADLSAGRAIYDKTCAQCHMLFGAGQKIGPDLTGAQRSNLDYLLSNILDPSGVVGKEYRMSVVLLDDGRLLSGLIVSQNEKTLVMQTQSRLETIAKDMIEEVKETTLSPMPDGLLTVLTEDQVRDLIGYLMHPTQIGLPK